MKWVVTALSVVTVSIWGVVLYVSLGSNQQSDLVSTDHEQKTYSHETKQPNVFLAKEEVTSKEDIQEADHEQPSLATLVQDISDDDVVGIDELLSALDIEFE